MNGYNFTETVRMVLAMARKEAQQLDHEYVGTEHILLGLIRETERGHDGDVAVGVLQNLGADLYEIRRQITATIKKGRQSPGGNDLPYTSRAKKVLELAMAEARDLNHNYVGTEHILLGLLREEKGIAAQVLNAAGITPARARVEVLRLLGKSEPGRESTGGESRHLKGAGVKPGDGKWSPERPHTLVIACSDGRLQEQTDAFLTHQLGLAGFDRFYVPGGGGALASSGRDFIRAEQLRRECAYVIELHEISRVILLFHGPAADGPPDAVCADYKRKLPWTSPEVLRDQQRRDAIDLIQRSNQWAGKAQVSAYRCEIDGAHHVAVVRLDAEKSDQP